MKFDVTVERIDGGGTVSAVTVLVEAPTAEAVLLNVPPPPAQSWAGGLVVSVAESASGDAAQVVLDAGGNQVGP